MQRERNEGLDGDHLELALLTYLAQNTLHYIGVTVFIDCRTAVTNLLHNMYYRPRQTSSVQRTRGINVNIASFYEIHHTLSVFGPWPRKYCVGLSSDHY